jgi:hypothetical protein
MTAVFCESFMSMRIVSSARSSNVIEPPDQRLKVKLPKSLSAQALMKPSILLPTIQDTERPNEDCG